MLWIQRPLVLPEHAAGFHLITALVVDALPELKNIKTGMLNLFLQHTSAALTINENADGDVLEDLYDSLDKLAPESDAYRHTIEGSDDMPGHIKSSLLGVSLNIPVSNGDLLLGVWQDVYLCEYRHANKERTIILTLQGEAINNT
ncbi:MAG: secondary thiamine-phosphate synthase enzyme YjbQ [Planctomycetia bacterium]|nr:secondary thiamine-phosphate synthase enzyme YjbQ [Planctomycetia bacterium]